MLHIFHSDGLLVLGNRYPLSAYKRSGQAQLRVPLSLARVKPWIEGLLVVSCSFMPSSENYLLDMGIGRGISRATRFAHRSTSGLSPQFSESLGESTDLLTYRQRETCYRPILAQNRKNGSHASAMYDNKCHHLAAFPRNVYHT